MYNNIMNKVLLLLIIFLFGAISSFWFIPIINNNNTSEGFQRILGKYPSSENGGLLNDEYTATGYKVIGHNSGKDIWKNFPLNEVGSYAQTNNHIRYPKNPDEGTCMPAEFCGVFYRDTPDNTNNIVTQLPPVPPGQGSRVNYYWTQDKLNVFTTGNQMAITP